MEDLFEIASGSVPGRWHIESGRNNQDALACFSSKRMTVLVATDGCSDGAYSEVGARIGAGLTATSIAHYAGHYDAFLRKSGKIGPDAFNQVADFPYWERARQDVLSHINILAGSMGGSFSKAIFDHFLFTIVGALIAEWGTYIFSIGDGIYALNGQDEEIGPFPDNEPPYLVFALTGSSLAAGDSKLIKFRIHEAVPTSQVDSLLVGTDGLTEFIAAEGELVPGKKRSVGPLSRFWEEDRCFTNADHVRRILAGLNQTVKKPDWEGRRIVKHIGFLTDDTTLIVARRKEV